MERLTDPDGTRSGTRSGRGPEPSGGSQLLTLGEAAELVSVSERALRKRVSAGTLPHSRQVRNGRVVVVVELAELAQLYPEVRNQTEPRAEPRPDGPDRPDQVPDRSSARLAVVAARHGALAREARQLRLERDQALARVEELAHGLGQARERLRRLEALPAAVEEGRPTARRGRAARQLQTALVGVVVVALAAGGAAGWRIVREADSRATAAQAALERAGAQLDQAEGLRAGAALVLDQARVEREALERERHQRQVARVLLAVERRVLEVVAGLVLLK